MRRAARIHPAAGARRTVIPAVAHTAARALGARVRAAAPVAGGDINDALRVTLDDGRAVFVKHRRAAPAGMYAAEARSLRWLARAGDAAPRVPRVLVERHDLLALEWIESGPPAADHDERLGRALAALHRAGAPTFGADADGFIGTLPLPNAPAATWAEFYGARRLAPLVRMGVDGGALPPECGRLVERLRARLPALLGPAEPPARLHGDLWAGNAMTDAHGHPVLVDPAAHGGHREVDLAMMHLFGGFGPRVFAAYAEALPPAAGHEDRRELHQLHPLLVHAVLFGGGYITRAARILARYA